MSPERTVYVHLVPHSVGDAYVEKDPAFEVLFKKKLIPKVDLLVLEHAPSADHRTYLKKVNDIRRFYLKLRSNQKARKDFEYKYGGLQSMHKFPVEKFHLRYFLESGAEDVVFEGMLYDEGAYEKLKDIAVKLKEVTGQVDTYVKRGEFSRARDLYAIRKSLLYEMFVLRDSYLPPLIERDG